MQPMVDFVWVYVPFFHTKPIRGAVRERHVLNSSGDKVLDYSIFERHFMSNGSASSMVGIRSVDIFDDLKSDFDSIKQSVVRYSSILPDDFLTDFFSEDGLPLDYVGVYPFLEIKGNLNKYFQGHNVFGSSDIHGLIVDFLLDVLKEFGLQSTSRDVYNWRNGFFYPFRIDLNFNFWAGRDHTGSFSGRSYCSPRSIQSDYRLADRFLRAFKRSATLNGRPFVFPQNMKQDGVTVYHDVSGQIKRLKLYNKYYDLKKHKPDLPQPIYDRLLDFSSGLVRVELQLNSLFFRRHHFNTLFDFRYAHRDLSDIILSEIHKIKVGGAVMDEQIIEMLKREAPSHHLPVLYLWLDGRSPSEIRENVGDNKYYRSRRFLLQYGVNIGVVNEQGKNNRNDNVIPIMDVITASPAECPDWMKEKGLIYNPSRQLLTVVN